jgi:DNA-binding LacI/PurR family transcriptional regulator
MSISIRDISKHVGLSVSTVSKALNGYSDIAAETKATILKATKDLGYHPNTIARNLRRQRTEKIGVVYPAHAFESEIMTGFFRGVVLAAELHGYNLTLYTAPAADSEALRQICRSREVDGMILMGTSIAGVLQDSIKLLQEEKIPFVVLGHPVRNKNVPFVASDNAAGIQNLMKHFLGQGHTRIAFIARSDDPENNAARLNAYKQALKKAKLSFCTDYVVEAPYSAYSGMNAMRELLELPARPTAVVAFNDHIAIDACRAAQEQGLNVPKDIAIAGYGNIPSSLITTPAITTVAMPLKEMGEATFENLLTMIETGGTPASHVFPIELVVRASTV